VSKIQVCRPHSLGEQDCQNLAEELLNKLVDKFGGSYQPVGNNYAYKHTAGVNATVEPLIRKRILIRVSILRVLIKLLLVAVLVKSAVSALFQHSK